MNRYDLVILGMLDKEPQHGYDIKNTVESHNMDRWANISVSTIYHRLSWLAKHGFIEGVQEQVGNRPVRTIYSITEEGRGLLEDEVCDFISGFSDDPRTLGLAHIHCLPKEKAIEQIKLHITKLNDEIRELKKIIRKYDQNKVAQNKYSPLLNKLSIEHMRVELKYMKYALEILQDDEQAGRIHHYFDLN